MKKPIVYLALFIAVKGFSQTSISQLPLIKDKAQVLVKENLSHNRQAAIVSVKDSTYFDSWTAATSQWSPPARVIYGYNAASKENSYIYANLIGSAWVDNNRQLNYTFDANANLLGYEAQYWNNTTWENSQKVTYTYDNANNQLTGLTQNWDISTSGWANSLYTVNTYDSNHNRLTSINQSWDASSSTWENQNKETVVYSTNHQYTSDTYQMWNSATSAWDNSDLYTNFVYTNGDLISLEGQTYDQATSAYSPAYKLTNTYDGSHHLMNSISQEFDSNTMTWENSDKEDYTYDTQGNQVTYIAQRWNTTTSAWENSFRQFDYYSLKTVGINTLSKQETTINLYPNPAKGELSINSAIAIMELNILDLTGKKILTASPANSNFIKLDVSSLAQGVYVVELKSASTTVYKKIIKE